MNFHINEKMQLNCVTWLVSPSLLGNFELEELEFS